MKNNTSMNVNISAKTVGNGLWSRVEKTVRVSKFELHYPSKDTEKNNYHCELRAYFPVKSWNIEKHGLIYTDRNWLTEFRKGLMESGFSKKAANDVCYSEQGMQGDNYVSLDAGDHFIKEYAIRKLFKYIDEY